MYKSKNPISKRRRSFSTILCFLFLMSGLAHSQSESEPNDRRDQANEIRLGQSVTGHFQKRGDYDWFKLVVDKPGKNIIRIDLSGVPDVDVTLAIYDEAGRQLKGVSASPKGEPEAITNFGIMEGTYYITAYGRDINEKDAYTLSTRLISPWEEGQEFEPNDDRDLANEIRLDETVEGFFQVNHDYDWYRLVIDKPGKNIIRLELSGVSEVNVRLEVADEGGTQLKYSNFNGKGEPESIINLGVTEGIYYIAAYGYEANQDEKYTLSTRLIGPWKEGQEFEPNNERRYANEIKLDMEIEGHIQPREDHDYYLITVPEPGMDIFVVDFSSTEKANLHLELLDAEGNRIKSSNLGAQGVDEQIVKMKFSPGQYYIYAGSSDVIAETTYTLRAGKPAVPSAKEEEVRKALEKALDFLVSKQTDEGDFIGYYEKHAGTTGLSLMAFVGAGCVSKDYTSNITKAVDFIKSQYHPSSSYDPGSQRQAREGGLIGRANPMYEHGIATLALTETLVETNDLSLEPIIEDAIQMILKAQNTENKPELLRGPITPDSKHYGGWRYNPDSTDSDLSVSGWPILALKAVLNAGFTVPDWSIQKALHFLHACHDESDGSFAYMVGGGGSSCVRAGIGALCLQLIGEKNDPHMPPALRFMQNDPPVWNKEDPGNGYPFYYWYYGTRAMLNAGGDDWRIWKDWMCRLLVDHQSGDGSWDGAQSEKNMPVYRTALGALMLELCCGHLPVYMRERIPRPGSVEVVFEEGKEKIASKNVELILDASNSMWGQIAGEAKISIAKNVLEQIINGLPDEMNVGLRLYGHRYGLNDRRACQDTELKVPIDPIDKTALIDIIQKIQPKGKTPLVYSVLQAGADFKDIPNGSIILITDGIESCDGDINTIAPALKESGIELRLHIVGFDIKEAEARAELEAIAKSTEGTYLDAKDSQELLSSLEQTMQIEFEILDEKSQVIAKGLVGAGAIRIMEGSYTLRLLVDPEPFETAITVKPRQKSTFVLTKEQEKWTIKETK